MFKSKTIKLFLMLGVILFSLVGVVGCSNVESEKINVKILYRDDIYNIEINKGSKFYLSEMSFVLNKEDAIVLYGDNFEKKYNNESLSRDVVFMICDYNGTENLGKTYTLEDAYDKNYIGDNDINKIYNNYTNSNNNIMLEKEIELKILNDRLVELKERNNDAVLEDISIYGYYGNYNNSYVIRLNDKYNDFTTVEKELIINDVIFQYSGPSFLVWVDENENCYPTDSNSSNATYIETYFEDDDVEGQFEVVKNHIDLVTLLENDTPEKYNEDFFEDKSLLVFKIVESSGGNKSVIESYIINDKTLNVYVKTKQYGDTADMGYWWFILELNKEESENFESIKIFKNGNEIMNGTTNEIKSFYTLQEAYRECLLNIEVLEKIAAYHNNGQQAKDKLDIEIINKIKEIAAYKWQNDELTSVINAKAEDFVITKYYGTYNNAIVFMINNPYFESSAEDLGIIETIAGIDFYYSSTDRIFVLENINCN